MGQKKADAWRLHDVYGNVWEWIEDCWHENYEGASDDGSAWLETDGGNCTLHVIRGGSSWATSPLHVRSASRNHQGRIFTLPIQGFGLARDMD